VRKIVNIVLVLLACAFTQQVMAQSDTSNAVLVVTPNPADDEITIKISPVGRTLKGCRIYDLIGNEVYYIDLSNRSGVVYLTLDISHLKTGIYFCNIYTDRGILDTRKIIKNR
jgi:hypothetical protein